MEIEKDIIRLSPRDVHDAYSYAALTGDSDAAAFAESLAIKLDSLEADIDYLIPIIQIPYSIKVVEFMNRASRHAIEQSRITIDEIMKDAGHGDSESFRRQKRQQLVNNVVVNLAIYRAQKRPRK